MIAEFLRKIDSLKKVISKNSSININSQKIKTQTIDVAKEFFSVYRKVLQEKGILDPSNSIDANFQDLLRLTQGNNSKTRYTATIKAIEKVLKELSIQETSISINNDESFLHQELKILTTLEAMIPSASLSYRQALLDLGSSTNKVSYRGTATELRESLRETLDHLAPDIDIMKETGFKCEPNQTKPTMKQKVRYILKKRAFNDTKRIPTEKSVEMVDEIVGQMARAVYNRASLSTHLETSKQEVIQVKRYIDIVFHEILELG